LESERLPSIACLRLFYVPLTFLDSSVRFWDFAVPIRCFFCYLTALVRSLSLGTAFSLHVFCLHVKIHMLLLYMYIYIFINGHTVYFLWYGAGDWSTFCVRVLVDVGRMSSCLHVFMSASAKDSDKVGRSQPPTPDTCDFLTTFSFSANTR
jgi:hypothetical protein